MERKPRLAKAHSYLAAEEYRRLGWILVHEFRADGIDEAYEYLFEWTGEGEPLSPDWDALLQAEEG